MFILPKDWKFPEKEYGKMKSANPYELKPSISALRIREWIEAFPEQTYVSFSGGMDSTVMCFLIAQVFDEYQIQEELHLVFSDTGQEYPAIRRFSMFQFPNWLRERFPNVKIVLDVIRPKKGDSFADICREDGFPLVSKETAVKIRKLRKGNLSEKYRNYLLNGDSRGSFGKLASCWKFLADSSTVYDTSEKCCDRLKKKPFKVYAKLTGRSFPFIGIVAMESKYRENLYNKHGCSVYDSNSPKCTPVAFWYKEEILRYAVEHEILYCDIYGNIVELEADSESKRKNYVTTGESRTGCCACGFGAHYFKGENRFQRLQQLEPEMHAAAMRLENNGICYCEALRDVGVEPYLDGSSMEVVS